VPTKNVAFAGELPDHTAQRLRNKPAARIICAVKAERTVRIMGRHFLERIRSAPAFTGKSWQ
jgi:hypothetical protein